MILEYRKVKCDECGKEQIIEDFGSLPVGWLTISINEAFGNVGHSVLNKEVCSRKCVLRLIAKIKKIPKVKFKL